MIPGLRSAELAAEYPDAFEHATCKCGLPIIRLPGESSRGWIHETGERHCRAALYTVDLERWLRTYPDRRVASPAR